MIGSRIGLSSSSRLSSFGGLTRRFINNMTETVTYPGIERWKGRVAVVTGASAGMGYQLAKTLAQLGVVTVGCARNPKTIEVSISVCVCVLLYRRHIIYITDIVSRAQSNRRQSCSHKM